MDPPTAYVFPDAYDHITVLKGPQSVALGPGNSAGVVLFEREHTPAQGLSLYAAPTFGSLAQLPPLETRIGLQYSTDRSSLGGLGRVVAAPQHLALNQGNIVGQDLGPTSGFAVFSLNGSVRVHRLASLSMGVDNLLDKTYAEFISRSGAEVTGFPTTTRVNEPGRTLWVKLDYRY